MCEHCENERRRLTELALANPKPCLVCGSPDVVGAGTWMPDESRRIAVGAPEGTDAIFAFCLCETHIRPTEENANLVKQTILRNVQLGKSRRIY